MEKTLTTINVSLPIFMRSYLEARVQNDGFGSISDLIRALIREDQKRESQEKLDKRLLTALDSGEATQLTSNDWDTIKSSVKSKIARIAKQKK